MKIYIINIIKNPKNFLSATFFYLSIYSTSIVFYLSFDIVLSPDFEKYFNYFEMYSGQTDISGLEQGNLYFFLNYLFIKFVSLIEPNYTINEVINISIYFVNSLIFLFGCIGLKKYLDLFYKTYNNYFVISIICFLPSSMELRASLKPEILGFAILSWLLYYFSIKERLLSKLEIYKVIFLSAFLINSKVSVAAIGGSFLLIYVFFNNRVIFEQIKIKHLVVFALITTSLLIENYNLNGQFINEVNHNENYDNRADLEFFKNINTKDLKNNPNRYFHSDSFLSITLFDTFNDFFLIYWNSEYTELNKERKDFFRIVKRTNQQPPIKINFDKENVIFTFSGDFDERWDDEKYLNETRMRFSFVTSVIFYVLLIIYSFIKKNFRVIFLGPFIGMLIISFSALGYFGTNNFDPLIGDAVKTYYYSFLILISFSVLLSEIINFEFLKKIFGLILILLFLFFIGFPFTYSESTQNDIIYKNSLLLTCELNRSITDIFFGIREALCGNDNLDINKAVPVKPTRNLTYNISKFPYVNILFLIAYFIFSEKLISKIPSIRKKL